MVSSGTGTLRYPFERSDGRSEPISLGVGVGVPVVLLVGSATDDAGIVAEMGIDTLYADGSLFLSVAGGGLLFQKRSGTWTSI